MPPTPPPALASAATAQLGRLHAATLRPLRVARPSSDVAAPRPGAPWRPGFTTASPRLGPRRGLQTSFGKGLRAHLTPALLARVGDFWFEHLRLPGSLVVPSEAESQPWFHGSEDMDRACMQRFSPALEAIRRSGATSGHEVLEAAAPRTPRDWLHLVLLLDQLPRNCYRGDAAAVVFATWDPLAREVARAALARGIPHRSPQIRWQLAYRPWFYLPLMHSESLADHERALREYEAMRRDVRALATADAGPEPARDSGHRAAAMSLVDNAIDFERRHMDLIRRFGRYPHRNQALRRASTAAEADYLAAGGETFGR